MTTIVNLPTSHRPPARSIPRPSVARFGHERLGNDALMVSLREAIAEARRRPDLKPALRQHLAAEIDEIKMEALASSSLTPSEIVEKAKGRRP